MSDDEKGAAPFNTLKGSLTAAIAVVVCLLAAFGGFLTNIAPPKVPDASGQSFAIGLASFVALILLLLTQYLVTLLATVQWARIAWGLLAAGAAVTFMIVALEYRESLEARTFTHNPLNGTEPVRHIAGSRYTERAKRFVAENETSGPEDLMQQAGVDDPMAIWTRESILATETTLIREYQILIISLCLSLFSLGWISVSGVQAAKRR